jgi:endonuclease/exonuclease/phosphatase family metal-dependent hydrolase
MRLVTWNVQHGQDMAARLASLRARFSPDVLAMQEPPAAALGATLAWEGGKPEGKGVAFDSLLPCQRVLVPGPSSPAIAARITASPLGPFNALAVWAQKTDGGYRGDVLRTLDQYDAFLREQPAVILGDFNLDARIKGRGREDFEAVRRRLEDGLGCCSAYHALTGEAFGQEQAATLYFRRAADAPFHCDFIWIPSAWRPRLQSVQVPGFADDLGSDHRPVVCEMA